MSCFEKKTYNKTDNLQRIAVAMDVSEYVPSTTVPLCTYKSVILVFIIVISKTQHCIHISSVENENCHLPTMATNSVSIITNLIVGVV